MGITVTRIARALGATVEGVRFDGDDVVDADQVRTAWLEHEVVLFPRLDPTPEEHLALARALGTPEVHGDSDDDSRTYDHAGGHAEISVFQGDGRADFWHTDATFRPEPPSRVAAVPADGPPGGR